MAAPPPFDLKADAIPAVVPMHVEQGTDLEMMATTAEEVKAESSVDEEAIGDHLPDGYYYSFDFISMFVALRLSSVALYVYLLMPSAALTMINNALGPSPLISWWAIGRTACVVRHVLRSWAAAGSCWVVTRSLSWASLLRRRV